MVKEILDSILWRIILLVGIILGTTLSFWLSDIDWRSKNEKSTQSIVDSIADELDQKIVNGVYLKFDDLGQKDAWGNSIEVAYEQEGVGQRILVRSAGKDALHNTDDDIEASRWLLNATGLGKAASSYVGDVARESAKGAVEGLKESVKESVKGKLGGLLEKVRSKDDSSSEQVDEANP